MTTILDSSKMTPMMVQWYGCKQQSQDAVLFFRMGDFYEAFHDDAVLISKELEVALTKRQEIPMAGVPYHAAEGYIDRLVAKGYRVAIAEQTEDPKKAVGLVKREIVRVVSPGALLSSNLLNEKANNFFAALSFTNKTFGLAFIDTSTADFRVIEFRSEREMLDELYRIRPAEVLVSHSFQKRFAEGLAELKHSYNYVLSLEDDWHFDYQMAYPSLTQHLKVHSLDGFGLKNCVAGVNSAGALLTYMKDRLHLPSEHIRTLTTYSTSDFLSLDRTTQRNLELTESLQDGSRRNTLLSVLDATRTPMGGRLLRHWVKQPLLCPKAIRGRQEAVMQLHSNEALCQDLGNQLGSVRDLERLMMKVTSGYASPRDLLSLGLSLRPLPSIKRLLGALGSSLLSKEDSYIADCSELVTAITEAMVEDPPARVSDGSIFREGYHRELDELRSLGTDAKAWLARYQAKLKEDHGIKTLKVGFNRVFGYFIEVSRAQAHLMPEHFQRRQTLVNNERFISPELKEYESKILSAEDRIGEIETELFNKLRALAATYYDKVMLSAAALARIDCINGFAYIAKKRDYVCPAIDDSKVLEIRDGRHPVIEAAKTTEAFIPNDTELNGDDSRLFLITGPNMAGKSTYIRQVALLTIMAQMGSFIPASSARIGVVDKVFTRIGASDDLARGQSTFMVEMTETANILNNVTDRSLVILDEIGRGTSTYDGISIAWAVAEYLLKTPARQAKTLFATHYWELTRLEDLIPGAVNYNVAVQECQEDIIFLRKIVRGGTDRSYGIHVARLAGLPREAIGRAWEILQRLEESGGGRSEDEDAAKQTKILATPAGKSDKELQLLLFEPKKRPSPKTRKREKLEKMLEEADPNYLTPIQAHGLLQELRSLL